MPAVGKALSQRVELIMRVTPRPEIGIASFVTYLAETFLGT